MALEHVNLTTPASDRARPSLHVDLRGFSAFEHAVLVNVREIPHGEVRPCTWIAQQIGHPWAVRAAHFVRGRNPVPLRICREFSFVRPLGYDLSCHPR